MHDSGEHLFAGPGFTSQQNCAWRVRNAPSDAEEFGRLLRDPKALCVSVELLGWPQCGALLFVSAVLVEGPRHSHKLSDRGDRTPMT
jgi:hypothetical protein